MGYTDAASGWSQNFVSSTPVRTANPAVLKADGSPHVAAAWVDLEGDDVEFCEAADTVKVMAILRDPRESLCGDDERPPVSSATIVGPTTTSTDGDDIFYGATRIGGPVHGTCARRGLGTTEGRASEMVGRMTPTRIVAKVDIAA
jgi:hypothetical protein